MTLTYEDALQQVLEAVRNGEGIEPAIARFPEHAAALREDARLSEGVARLSTAVPAPRAAARADASRRMHAQLATGRTPRAKPAWPFGGLSLPRYVLAAALVVVAVLGAGLLLDSGGTTVEAATIEGVVVDNSDGMLTVQTLDMLERVKVPAGTLVSDVAGASIGLAGIEVGQVVVVDVERRGRDVIAQRIQRFVDSIEAWCTDDSVRCQKLSQELEQAQRQCARSPAACRFALDRLEQLRLRASDSARLEELKQGCRLGEDAACRQLVGFCRERLDVCGNLAPLDPPITDRPLIGDRLRTLLASCLIGDETACRQLALACKQYADLCPIELPLRPAVSPTTAVRPVEVTPSLNETPSSAPAVAPDAPPVATATPAAVEPASGEARPAATPSRDAEPPGTAEGGSPSPTPIRDTAIEADTSSHGSATPEPTAESQPADLPRAGDAPSDR